MKVAIVGSTGLIGSSLLKILIESKEVESIFNLTRSASKIESPKVKNIQIDFDKLESTDSIFSCDVVYCCLGTTIKIAKSKEAFKKVDFTYIVNSAIAAKKQGVKKFLVVSALGVDANSPIFYNQVKGETENALKQIGFESLQIYRPSLLLGDRKEFRIGEEIGNFIGNAFSFAFIGDLKKYKPIHVDKIAKAMFQGSLTRSKPIEIIESDEMNID